jgi:hypothetical protein
MPDVHKILHQDKQPEPHLPLKLKHWNILSLEVMVKGQALAKTDSFEPPKAYRLC